MNERTYKIKLNRRQNGKVLYWHKEDIITSKRKPKIGEGRRLLVDPPIEEYIVEIEEILNNN